MKKLIIVILLINIFSCQGKYSEFNKKLDKILKDSKYNGSFLVVDNGKTIYKKGFGITDKDDNYKIKTNTKFLIGSVSKQFTAVGIMKLHENGKLKLDDDITKYIDVDNWKGITIHHLLSNTSGIIDYLTIMYWDKIKIENYYSTEEVIGIFNKEKTLFEAGTMYQYSNSNFILLSYIIEKVSGQNYGDFMNDNIFIPLNMNNSGFTHTYMGLENRALGYYKHDAKMFTYFSPSIASGAGGIYSTVEDIKKWNDSFYTDFLTEDSKMLIFSSHNKIVPYGYGFFIEEDNKVVQHAGSVMCFKAYSYLDIENQRYVISLTNISRCDPVTNTTMALRLLDEIN